MTQIQPPNPRLAPIISYYGSKWSIAHKYPPPKYDTIIEPFAGGAGYSLLWHDRNIILIDKNPQIIAIWNWLIQANPDDILSLPEFTDPEQTVNDITQSYPDVIKWLIGWWVNSATTQPCQQLTPWKKIAWHRKTAAVWNAKRKKHLAQTATYIKHWSAFLGDYQTAPDIPATWFIDPPYYEMGKHYKYNFEPTDYNNLAKWCKQRKGQIIVCEAANADWLPFQPLTTHKGAAAQRKQKKRPPTKEVIWTHNNI